MPEYTVGRNSCNITHLVQNCGIGIICQLKDNFINKQVIRSDG